MRLPLLLCLATLAAAPASGDPAKDRADLTALRDLDGRLNAIGFRLATANAPLCADRQPAPGWTLHAIDQYAPSLRPAARDVFGFASAVAVEAVVPGGPAARAGVQPNDGLLAIDDTALPSASAGDANAATRDAVLDRLAALPADRPMRLSLLRAGERRSLTLSPMPACRSAFELLLGRKPAADSDGRMVQVGISYFARFDDDQVAVVVAHELAHIILRHRARLEAAGVHWGAFAGFGRSGRLFRRTEDEADALGAILLRNAGYDPRIAVTFWQHDIGGLDGGLSLTHVSAGERARRIAAAIAAIPPGAPTPWTPPIVETQNQPLG